MTGGRGLIALGCVLFAVLAAVAVELGAAQRESRDAAERRFEQRAQISAALTQSAFDALGRLSARDLGRDFAARPAAHGERLARLVERGALSYAAVLDSRGEVIARVGRGAPRRGAERAPRVLSDVRRTPAGPIVELDLPFTTRDGDFVLVEGIPVAVLRTFFQDFLRRLPNPDGATLVIADRRGVGLARVTPAGAAASTRDALTAVAAVPGTTWRLRLQAERARVLAGSGGGGWLGWLLIAALACATLAGLWLSARALASARRTTAAGSALRESEAKLRALVGALEEAVLLVYADGRVELLNESAKTLIGTDADVVADTDTGWVAVNEDGSAIAADQTPAAISFATGAAQRRIVGIDRPGHERIWLDVSTRPLTRPGESSPYAVVCSCTDVTLRQDLEAHLLDLADRDPLTGLWNRRRFEQDLAHQLDRCRRYGERGALVLIDVDDFKQVNDVLGHLAGDEVLRALGDALSSRLRSSDRAARLGGDEFAVLLLDVDELDVEGVTAELVAALGAAGGAAVQQRIKLSVSAGSTVLDHATGPANAALEAADRAMYASKQSRDGRITISRRAAVGASAEVASLRALLAAVNARDSYTAMHSREVVALARGVARRLGLDDTQISEVEHIALLHDLGKIAIPDAILRKPGPLTSHEQTLMRQHPVVGAQILGSMPELAHLSAAARAEHERWDGAGYPDGLAGEQIPIASRIALVCDAYHAMTSNRPYRRAMSTAAAREEIHRECGAQFCPYASSALLDVLAASQESSLN